MKLKKRPKKGQDFELNLASILDCFTIIITYLLASASFLHLGLLGVNLASQETSITPPEDSPPLEVQVKLTSAGQASLITSGAQKQEQNFELTDLEKFLETLKSLKEKFPETQTALFSVDENIIFEKTKPWIGSLKKVFSVSIDGLPPIKEESFH